MEEAEDFWGTEREGKKNNSNPDDDSQKEDDDDDIDGGEMMPILDSY